MRWAYRRAGKACLQQSVRALRSAPKSPGPVQAPAPVVRPDPGCRSGLRLFHVKPAGRRPGNGGRQRPHSTPPGLAARPAAIRCDPDKPTSASAGSSAATARATARATLTSWAATLYSAPCGFTCCNRSPSRAACSASASVCWVTQATISSSVAAMNRRPNCARSG